MPRSFLPIAFPPEANLATAARGVDFEAKQGKLTFLVGPSGCGKTTLISVIAGLLDRSAGHVELFGQDLEELAPIEVTLPADGRREGEIVPVRLRSHVTEVGTLLLEAEPLRASKPDERWRVELSVRGE